jgi:hypothetical protein
MKLVNVLHCHGVNRIKTPLRAFILDTLPSGHRKTQNDRTNSLLISDNLPGILIDARNEFGQS